ncbi:ribonuclease H-like domain-containing protein [Tanacetum coccineum]
MDTGASSYLNFNASNLSTIFDKRLFPSIHVGDGKSIPSHHLPLHLHNVLVTPNIIKNLNSVRQFARDNNYTIEFDAFGFSVKDYLTRHILLRCDSSGDLYPVTKPSTFPIAFLSISASTWHQRLGHPGIDFDETFSPIIKLATVHTVLSLVVSRKWLIHQLDVKNAFLNGDLSETVYMHQPPVFVDNRYPHHGSQVAYLLIYVDDIILTASCPTLLQQIISSLNNEFDMTGLGPLNYFLVQQICLYMHDPREPHFAVLKCILRYIRGTVYFGLQLYISASTSLVGYTDADWEVAHLHAGIHHLLRELHSPLSTATLVYCDNVSIVYMSANPIQHQWMKHIEINNHFVRDMVTAGHTFTQCVLGVFMFCSLRYEMEVIDIMSRKNDLSSGFYPDMKRKAQDPMGYHGRSKEDWGDKVNEVGRGGRGRRHREGNDERVEDLNGQRNDQGLGANGGNLLPAMLAQVSNRGNVGNQNGNVVNENVQENVGNMIVNDNRWFHELARIVPHLVTTPRVGMFEWSYVWLGLQIVGWLLAATEPKTMQKAMQISGALTDEAVRNGSIWKVEKRGNVGEPRRLRMARDDNKRTWVGNVFVTTVVNTIGREEYGYLVKVPPVTYYICNPEGFVAHASTINRLKVIWQRIVEVCQGNVYPVYARIPPTV